MNYHTAQSACLISMPWALFNRPSVQLGALKSYVEQNSDCTIDTFHPYLELAKAITTNHYQLLSQNSWAAEALFSGLLFPDNRENSKKLFNETVRKKHQQLPGFEILSDLLEQGCSAWLDSVDWSKYTFIGLSLCFNQTLSSLYIASELKKLPYCPPIVFGGSSCGGKLGENLLQYFEQIDFVINGEGEQSLVALYNFFTGRHKELPPQVHTRDQGNTGKAVEEITDLNSLPTPDYTPYFQQLKQVFPEQPFIPELPVEFSRGCWWRKCTFCNLNLQWQTYRWKKATTINAEIEELSSNHQCLDFTFCDNALPPKEALQFFANVSKHARDYHFFAEVRGTTDKQILHTFKRGGLHIIQVGIESLSSSLLSKMKKGMTAIENVAMLKHAMEEKILLEGNLIVEFPGSSAKEVQETLDTLEFILPFHPLSESTFFLGHGSPIEQCPEEYTITAITNNPKNRLLFPDKYCKGLELITKDYRGDKLKQRQLWQPVRKKIQAWQAFHGSRTTQQQSALSYRDGKDYLIIRQERPEGQPLRHRLQGLSREIYLYCSEIRDFEEITNHFKSIKPDTIKNFIIQLRQKKLMFTEGSQVISLAVHQQSTS